jgi:nucleotide-binding universal stress UspA family protein
MPDSELQIICNDLEYCQEVNSTINHILSPYDDSRYADRAFVYGLDLAKKYGAKLSVISIMYSPYSPTEIKHQSTVDEEKVKVMEKSFKKLQTIAKQFDVSINTDMIMKTEIVDSIIAFVSKYKVNLIVMGTRGRTANKRFMQGSVAIDTSQKAPCPVMLVK